MPHIEDPLNGPSVTQVLDSFDKGWFKYFYKKYGTVEAAEAYSQVARDRGTRIHDAFEQYLKGAGETGLLSTLAEEEQRAVKSLITWAHDVKLRTLAIEEHVINKEDHYNGTLDYMMDLDTAKLPAVDFWNAPVVGLKPRGQFIVDLKTKYGRKPQSSEIKKHALQLAAYSKCTDIRPDYGLILSVDVKDGTLTQILIQNLEYTFYPVFKAQRYIYDYINSKGDFNDLRRTKRKTS